MGLDDSRLTCDAYLHKTPLDDYLLPREIAGFEKYVTVRTRDLRNMELHTVLLHSTQILRRGDPQEFNGNEDAWRALEVFGREYNYTTFVKRAGSDAEFDYILGRFSTVPVRPRLAPPNRFEGAVWSEPDLKAVPMAAGSYNYKNANYSSDEWSE